MKLNKIEQNKAAKDGLDVGPEIDTFAKLGWENVDKTDLELRLKWYGMFWRPKTPGKFMLRLRVPNGVLHFNQLEVIADIISKYDGGRADITTRQNLQLRGILLEDLPEILKKLDSVGLSTIQSGFDNPRNVTGNPLAGVDPEEIIDTIPYVKELDNYLTDCHRGNREFSNLPRKWNTAVAGAKDNFLLHNDIVFHPVRRLGQLKFGVWIGGVLSSQMNAYAVPLNAWVDPEDICRLTGVICSIWRDNGERDKRPKGRFRLYLDSVGVDKFREMVVERFGPLDKWFSCASSGLGSKFQEKPRSHFGIHKQKQKGLYYAGIHIPVGRLDAVDLHRLSLLSRYGSGEVRLTEDQNVILVNIPEDQLDFVRKDVIIERYFPLEPGPVAAGTVACTGSQFCGFAITDTKGDAERIAKELEYELEIPEEVKIHWTGCPNSCGQAYMGGIGLTGTKVKDGLGYNITVGGSHLQVGEEYKKGVPLDELKDVLKELLIESFDAKLRKFPHL